jgi:hypothetical protein
MNKPGQVSSVVEHLPSTPEALDKKRKRGEGEETKRKKETNEGQFER